MPEGAPIHVKILPDGVAQTGLLRSSHGRVLEVEIVNPGADYDCGAAAELEDEEAVYLGMIERSRENRVWINVEHRLDRGPLNALRTVWREGG